MRRVVRRAVSSRLAEVIVVVGRAASAVRKALQDLEVQMVENPRYRDGQSSSVKAGLAAVDREATAAMFMPIDQPRLSTAVIDDLIEVYGRTAAPIVVPTFRGRRGAPVVIDRCLFGELDAIEGDVGGRQIFAAHEETLVELELESDDSLLDADTPADLEALEP